jgi:hypothetical protein
MGATSTKTVAMRGSLGAGGGVLVVVVVTPRPQPAAATRVINREVWIARVRVARGI